MSGRGFPSTTTAKRAVSPGPTSTSSMMDSNRGASAAHRDRRGEVSSPPGACLLRPCPYQQLDGENTKPWPPRLCPPPHPIQHKLLCGTLKSHLMALKSGHFHTQKKSGFHVSPSGWCSVAQCCPLWVTALLNTPPGGLSLTLLDPCRRSWGCDLERSPSRTLPLS